MIATGATLVRGMDERKISPDAAFWFYYPDIQAWKLVIAEAKVGIRGPKDTYRQIQKLLDELSSETKGLSLNDIAVARTDAPMVGLLRIALRTGPGISGVRFTNNVINGVVIEDAYIYRLP
jgi:hypothetical protein